MDTPIKVLFTRARIDIALSGTTTTAADDGTTYHGRWSRATIRDIHFLAHGVRVLLRSTAAAML